MTPEREKYLAKCSKKEQQIRVLIKCYKYELRKAKAVCSSYDLKKIGRKPFGYRLHIGTVKQDKVIISALYHELARLKGMDRVGRAVVIDFEGPYGYELYSCKDCKETLYSRYSFCPTCGRRILWEKVK